jgi:hypothetical protein
LTTTTHLGVQVVTPSMRCDRLIFDFFDAFYSGADTPCLIPRDIYVQPPRKRTASELGGRPVYKCRADWP